MRFQKEMCRRDTLRNGTDNGLEVKNAKTMSVVVS